jgi:flagellar motility protein MotE (MotC chaperone)
MIQRMIRNSTVPQLYELENGETIIISDEDIALELLSRFDPTRVGELLSNFDDTLASDISRKLTLPRNN